MIKNIKETNDDRAKILNYAQNKYLSEGFYKTSMDTLAGELQISKKTIYKYFATKNHLVEAVVQNTMKYMSCKLDEIVSKDENAVIKIISILDFLSRSILRASEKWMMDIKDHLPGLWNKIDRFRSKKMVVLLSKIIQQGKSEGLIEDKPNEVIVTVFISSIRAIINPIFLSENKLTINRVLPLTFEILLKGILTTAGLEMFYKSFPDISSKIQDMK